MRLFREKFSAASFLVGERHAKLFTHPLRKTAGKWGSNLEHISRGGIGSERKLRVSHVDFSEHIAPLYAISQIFHSHPTKISFSFDVSSWQS